MLDIFNYTFMVRALVAGLVIAVTIPLMGSFLVARRYSLIADSLAHVSLAGVGAGLLVGGAPLLVALPVTAGGALLLEWLRQSKRLSGEIGLAILMSSGLAIAVVLASFARGAVDFDSYLFGSIATTTSGDIAVLLVTASIIIGTVARNYRGYVHIAFDEDGARIAGYNVRLLNYSLAVMTAVMVVLSLQIVGGLLISALLVIPVVSASRLANGFGQTVLYAIVSAAIAVVTGLLVAFYAGIPAGGAIVLSALALLILTFIWKK